MAFPVLPAYAAIEKIRHLGCTGFWSDYLKRSLNIPLKSCLPSRVLYAGRRRHQQHWRFWELFSPLCRRLDVVVIEMLLG